MKLNKKQKEKIEELIYKFIEEEYKDFYESLKENTDFNKSLKDFKEEIYELIFNKEEDRYKQFKLLTDEYFNESYVLDRITFFKEDIEEKDLKDLLNFDEYCENLYTDEFYNDDDYYKEHLESIFYEGILDELNNSYTSYYISFNTQDFKEVIKEEDYEDFNEYYEDYENSLYEYIEKKDIIKAYIYYFKDEVLSFYTKCLYDEINKEIENIKLINIPKELNRRRKELKLEIKNQKIENEILEKNLNEFLKNKQNTIKFLEDEKNKIQDGLKEIFKK